MSHIFTGDTVRVRATFRDWAPEGSTGNPIDPDSSAATITVYDSDQNILSTGSATRDAVGSFYYDWTAPTIEGIFYFEYKGMFALQPQIARYRFIVRFRPDVVVT